MSGPERDWRDLVERYLDGVASQQEIAELNALLVTDEEVAAYFAEMAQLHAMVREEAVATAQGASDPTEAAPRKKTSTRRTPVRIRALTRPKYGQWAAYVLVPLAAAAAIVLAVSRPGDEPGARRGRRSVATRTTVTSDIWSDDEPPAPAAPAERRVRVPQIESPTLESHERAPVAVAAADVADDDDEPATVVPAVDGAEPTPGVVVSEQPAALEHVAYLDSKDGAVEWRRPGSERWIPAGVGIPITTGTGLRTKLSRARAVFDSGTEIHLNNWTTLTAADAAGVPGLDLAGGEVYVSVAEADEGFWVRTPRGLATDLGTRFGVRDKMNLTTVTVVEGAVEAATDAGAATVRESQEVLLIRRSSPPGNVRTISDAQKRFSWIEGRKDTRYLAGVDVLFVVGSGDENSLETVDRLAYDGMKAQGARVVVADEKNATDEQFAAADVVALSVTISSVKGAKPFRDVPVPLVVWEGWYDLGMRTDYGTSLGFHAINDETSVVIKAAGHELAAGLRGTVRVFRVPDRVMSAKPGPGAVTVVVSQKEPSKALVFGYERGARMAKGAAPARRVHFFVNRAMPSFNKYGWRLFFAAIKWAAKGSVKSE